MAQSWEAVKDPQEIVDYGIDWSDDLGNKTISASTWTVVSGGVVIDTSSFTNTTTTVRLSGGTAGTPAEVKNHITLSNGEEYELTCKLKVKSK